MGKIKEHFKKNKAVYISASAGIILCVVAAKTYPIVGKNLELLGGSSSKLLGGAEGSGKTLVDNTNRSFSFNFITKDSGNTSVINNAVTTIHKGTRGSAGFVVRHIESGQVFETQKAASEFFGISESLLSTHLNGLKETLAEGTFERLGVIS